MGQATIKVRFTEGGGGGGCLSEVTLEGDPQDGAIELTNMFTHPNRRGKGGARRVLGHALEWADKHRQDLWLRVAPFGEGGPRRSQLAALYGSVGFQNTDDWCMYRRCAKHK